MSTNSKFLPALALAAALVPFAANARSDRAPVQASAQQQQYLVGNFNGGQTSAASPGRAGERQAAAANPLLLVTEAQYAAINAVPEEN